MEDMDRLQMVETILARSTVYICKYLDPQQLLLFMQSAEALTHNDVRRIKSKVTESDQSEELLHILVHKPAKSYDAFMDALLEIGRKDIHNRIEVIEREVGYIRHDKDSSGDSSASQSPKSSSTDHSAGTSVGSSTRVQPAFKQVKEIDHQVTPTLAAKVQTTLTSAGKLKTVTTATAEEATLGQILAGPWNMVREFGKQYGPGKLTSAHHVTFSPDGDVVIADYEALKIKIFSLEGEYKSRFDAIYGQPQQIVISSDNTCFMTGHSEHTEHIIMYELDGKLKGSWAASSPHASSPAPELYGLAIDHAGDLLLGDVKNKYIYKHRQDGTYLGNIQVDTCPKYIAVTSQGTLVIADWDTAPQVISNTGQVLHTLELPANVPKWRSLNVYCHDGIIFISGQYFSGTLCYGESGKYLGTMPLPRMYPCSGLVITPDSKKLLVYENKSVKVFETPSI